MEPAERGGVADRRALRAVTLRCGARTGLASYCAGTAQPALPPWPSSGGRVLVTDVNACASPWLGARSVTARTAGSQLMLILGSGEGYKGFLYLRLILQAMLRGGMGRDAMVLALGGGVVGDVAGLAAACFMRGVRLAQHPTTLLACVDSSMGGKVGINTGSFKNAVGVIYPPCTMVARMGRVSTLPERQWQAGVAEAAKMAACLDRDFCNWLEAHAQDVALRAAPVVASMVTRCAELKSYVTARDDVEVGVRACLNLGHTIGHAAESGMRYRHWLHGEAVSMGVALMAHASHRLGLLTRDDATRLLRLLSSLRLPVRRPLGVDAVRLSCALAADKKNRGTSVCVVLLRDIGECCAREVPRAAVLNVWANASPRNS
ncbi:3-dehydroquinate synthase [Candidatus Tremblaya princeps]|uniref:3-dehydroquinate synthase n=1 Tax=Tremblaya princeps TaxID=189385 RepID=A0A143WNN3_TREPR|nr:3-dehydroquinate synthase [Candidatus Tremblaya princeps]